MSNACYRIPTENIYRLEKKLARFNNKAIKLNQSPLNFDIVHEELMGDTLYNWIQVVGVAPIMNNYTILGKITFDGNLILPNSAPGQSIPKKYYEGDNIRNNCEHCNSYRHRKITYILEHKEKGMIQVGSNCLGDFVDRNIARYILTYFTWVYELETVLDDEDFEPDVGATKYEHTMTALHAAQACILKNGWVSKVKAQEDFSLTSTYMEMGDYVGMATKKDIQTVDDALIWLDEQDSDDNEYMYKLKKLVSQEFCPVHHTGFLISLMGSYKNHLVRRAKREQRDKNKTPVVTGRIPVSGVVLKTDVKTSDWGDRYVMTFLDDRGFILWGSIPDTQGIRVEKDTRLSFTATVDVSDKDEFFGFYKRPSKCEVLQA